MRLVVLHNEEAELWGVFDEHISKCGSQVLAYTGDVFAPSDMHIDRVLSVFGDDGVPSTHRLWRNQHQRPPSSSSSGSESNASGRYGSSRNVAITT